MNTATLFRDHYMPLRPLVKTAKESPEYRVPVAEIDAYPLIEANNPTRLNLITVDLDGIPEKGWDWELKSLAWDEGAIPTPNIWTENRSSGRAQVSWFVEGWVRQAFTNVDGRRVMDPTRSQVKAVGAFQEIQKRLPLAFPEYLVPDRYYGARMTRNPLYAGHRSGVIQEELHSMREMWGFVGHLDTRATPRADQQQRGSNEQWYTANVEIFDQVRQLAYKAYLGVLYERTTFADFVRYIEAQLQRVNREQGSPMSERHIEHTASGIIKFCITHFSRAKFSEIQSHRSRKGRAKQIAVRQGKSQGKLAEVEATMKLRGITMKAACEQLGYTYGSIRNAASKARKAANA